MSFLIVNLRMKGDLDLLSFPQKDDKLRSVNSSRFAVNVSRALHCITGYSKKTTSERLEK